jgi:hypothetical protein
MSAKYPEYQTLLRLGVDVCPHLFGGTMFDRYLSLVNFVLYEEILNLDVLGAFRAARSTIGFQQYCTHVVLI